MQFNFFSKTFLKKHNGCFKCLCCLLLLCKKKLLAINVERQLAMTASLHNWKMEHKFIAWFERAHMDDMYNVLFALPCQIFVSWVDYVLKIFSNKPSIFINRGFIYQVLMIVIMEILLSIKCINFFSFTSTMYPAFADGPTF